MPRISIPHRYRSARTVLVVFPALTTLTLHLFGYSYWPSWIDTARSQSCVVPEPVNLDPGSRRPRIALAETSGTHDEVAAAVVYPFGSQSHVDLSYFSSRQRFGISRILDGFELASHYGKVQSLYAFTQAARQCPPPDIVVSITCELDLASMTSLLTVW
ncbi:hypothetical protein LZ31DRAFT_557264 [Colletotrichum somersetense]|nr:hypothetical protein LZ31DRAFT_557264 [Colletotrichum somersetense]